MLLQSWLIANDKLHFFLSPVSMKLRRGDVELCIHIFVSFMHTTEKNRKAYVH